MTTSAATSLATHRHAAHAASPVKSAGVVVGRVANIRFDSESYEAIVSMTVEIPRVSAKPRTGPTASRYRMTAASNETVLPE